MSARRNSFEKRNITNGAHEGDMLSWIFCVFQAECLTKQKRRDILLILPDSGGEFDVEVFLCLALRYCKRLEFFENIGKGRENGKNVYTFFPRQTPGLLSRPEVYKRI